MSGTDHFPGENIKFIEDLTTLLSSKISDDKYPADSEVNLTLYQAKESAESLWLLLQKRTDTVQADDLIYSACRLSSPDVLVSSKMHKIADGSAGKAEDYNLGGLAEKFIWECPENFRDRLSQTALPLKRKTSSLEGTNRRPRGDNAIGETVAQNTFSRGSGPPTAPSGPTRRDTFRQRKPNTSRPPSMHVDDYVARERNVDVTSSSNVISVPRIGSSSGRPPSIHVDEFMARQRERQNPVGMSVGDVVAQVKSIPPENDTDSEKSNKPSQLKQDLDDDLQGIDIVFDGEESESDDKLPFPQPDDNLAQPASVVIEQSSPHSIVEETESDVNESSQFSHLGAPLLSNVDENIQSEFSSRSVSHLEMPLTHEPSISSDRRYYEQSDSTKSVLIKTTSGFDSDVAASSSGFSASVHNKISSPLMQLPVDSRIPPHLHSKNSLQQTGNVPSATGSHGTYDRRFQPPLPPMPPPPTILPVVSQMPDPVPSQLSPFVNSMADVHTPLPPGFHTDYLSPFSNSSTSLSSSSLIPDSTYGRTSLSSPVGSSRPPPPLPPTPPPYLASSSLPSLKTSTSPSSVYSQTSIGTSELLHSSVPPLNDPRTGNLSVSGTLLTSYPPPPLMPQLLFSRPNSMPIGLYGSSPAAHQGENAPSISQNLPIPLPSFQSVQSLSQLQPLQPPQILRPPQPPQHLRPPIPASPQSDQTVSLIPSPVQMHVQPLQILQQPHVSPLHVYYQPPQQENFSHPPQLQQKVENSQPQVLHQQGDGTSQQQQDSGMSLLRYFSSPEIIQSLLSDRDKLCQLLEQHPRLRQMLEERLGEL
ncbi:hypothetical protein U1Q18_002700 [Sarracenia purpurea var. burkii]